MVKKKKSWQEKLADSKDLPKIQPIPECAPESWGKGTMLIPAPCEVDEVMKKVPKGKIATISIIAEVLAKKHGATICCPMTTGIFAWIASHAADEMASEGKKRITPYWRTVKAKGELNPKYPGGCDAIIKKLKAEGFDTIEKGRTKLKFFIKDYEDHLVSLEALVS